MRATLLKLIAIALLFIIAIAALNPDSIPDWVDQVRQVVGPQPVALAEDIFYGAVDQFNSLVYRGRTTPGYWDTSQATPASDSVPASISRLKQAFIDAQSRLAALGSTPSGNSVPDTSNVPAAITSTLNGALTALSPSTSVFQPANLTPPYPKIAAPGEGVWLPIPNAYDASAPPLMFKTFLHPDPQRSYTRVAIVAIDATRVRLHAVAGTQEPVSNARVPRPGLIPQTDLPTLVAAFNGGFRAIHGYYGMMVAGQTILPPQNYADTIALYRDGSIRIEPWSVLTPTLTQIDSYRQTPPFLAYQGQVNPALMDEHSTVWGSTVDRNTVIWRSALGLSADHHTLYYGVGESLTARRLAEAMVAGGASDVAELDVNLSFERFISYTPAAPALITALLLPAMNYKTGTYVTLAATRDFFYVTLAH